MKQICFIQISQSVAMALSLGDPNSHSEPEKVVTKHLHFDWDIDFERQTVSGQTTLTCHRIDQERLNLPSL